MSNPKGEVKLDYAGHGRWNIEIVGQPGSPTVATGGQALTPFGVISKVRGLIAEGSISEATPLRIYTIEGRLAPGWRKARQLDALRKEFEILSQILSQG